MQLLKLIIPDLAQVEGYSTADGRGVSIWDTFSATPGKVFKGETGTALYSPSPSMACHSMFRSTHSQAGAGVWITRVRAPGSLVPHPLYVHLLGQEVGRFYMSTSHHSTDEEPAHCPSLCNIETTQAEYKWLIHSAHPRRPGG